MLTSLCVESRKLVQVSDKTLLVTFDSIQDFINAGISEEALSSKRCRDDMATWTYRMTVTEGRTVKLTHPSNCMRTLLVGVTQSMFESTNLFLLTILSSDETNKLNTEATPSTEKPIATPKSSMSMPQSNTSRQQDDFTPTPHTPVPTPNYASQPTGFPSLFSQPPTSGSSSFGFGFGPSSGSFGFGPGSSIPRAKPSNGDYRPKQSRKPAPSTINETASPSQSTSIPKSTSHTDKAPGTQKTPTAEELQSLRKLLVSLKMQMDYVTNLLESYSK